jgi:hypothetical protein
MPKLFVNYIVYYILNFLHPILVAIAIKILSWEPPKQKPNPVRAEVSKKLAVPETIQETVPPIKLTDLKPSLDYKQILKEHEEAGSPIKPVKHRKPISKDIICPHCGALTHSSTLMLLLTYLVSVGKSRSISAKSVNISGFQQSIGSISLCSVHTVVPVLT